MNDDTQGTTKHHPSSDWQTSNSYTRKSWKLSKANTKPTLNVSQEILARQQNQRNL